MENKDNNIVMLPTEKADYTSLIKNNDEPDKKGLFWSQNRSKTSYFTQDYLKSANAKSYHLYVLLDDEIKEGDWIYYELDRKVSQIKSMYIHKEWANITKNGVFCKKIIATTDTSLNLPQPSKQFIEKYIEEYNKGNKNMKTTDGVHLSHCNQGEYEGSCKYGDENCPVMVDYNTAQDRIDGLIKQKDLHKYHEIVEKIKKNLIDEGFDEDNIYEYLEYNLYRLIHND